jgi:hypothetical protein
MECPVCNRPVSQSPAPDGGVNIFCRRCGWGAMPGNTARAEPPRPPIWQVALFWALALAIVIGPYFGLIYGIPALLDVGVLSVDEGVDRIVDLVRYNYWWVFGIYLVICVVFTPTYDPDQTGFLGGVIDNPFSFHDDWERQKRTFLFLMLPGKTVWAAFVLTKQLVKPG